MHSGLQRPPQERSPTPQSPITIAMGASIFISASTTIIRDSISIDYPVPYFDARNGPPNYLFHNEGKEFFRTAPKPPA